MEQKYAEPLILCPPMQLNIIKMYILLVFMVYISKKQELLVPIRQPLIFR